MKNFVTYLLSMIMIPIVALGQDGAVVDEVVAVVGSEILLKSDVEKQIIQYKSQGIQFEDDDRCRVMEELLYSKLLLNQAKLDSVVVSDQQVEGELDRRISYFISQIGSERALEEYYKKSMEEIKNELRANLRDQMIIQQMQGTVTTGMNITPSEIKQYYKDIPQDSLPFINAQIEVAQLVVYAPPSRKQVEESRTRLNELRERVISGEDFATLAILYLRGSGNCHPGR